jgi:hypothetical protein
VTGVTEIRPFKNRDRGKTRLASIAFHFGVNRQFDGLRLKGDRPGKAPGNEWHNNRPDNSANSQKKQSIQQHRGAQNGERVKKRKKTQKSGWRSSASGRSPASDRMIGEK